MNHRRLLELKKRRPNRRQLVVRALLKSLFGAIVAAVLLLAAVNADAAESVPGQFLVKLKKPSSQYDVRTIEKSLNGKIADKVRADLVLIQRTTDESVESALKALHASPIVVRAEPNFIYKALKAPNDPEYSKLWGLNNIGDLDHEGTRGLKGVDIGVEKAWDITTGSKDVVVAVIDTGVDFKIPDLANNAWTNTAELNGQQGVDDDQNGYIDDIHGYDFVNNKGDVTDDNGHGSHCAGTIGAEGGDGRGIVGVNWNVSIMAIKFLDSWGSGTLANAVKAMDYARKSKARVLSNSWGGAGASQELSDVVAQTVAANQLFVAAAGNDASDNDKRATYPASFDFPNMLVVAAVDNRGELANFSNFGAKTVHVAAPGVNVLSTVPSGFDVYSGTSMAAPHASGVAALLLSTNKELSYQDLKTRVIGSARPIKGLEGKVTSGGMLDAYYALTGAKPPPDPNDPSIWSNTNTYSASTPHPYPAKFEQTYTLKVEGATRISARFAKFETEPGYDRVQFLNAKGESLGFWSGNYDVRYSPIADGDTLVIKITADDSQQLYGFDIDGVVFEK